MLLASTVVVVIGGCSGSLPQARTAQPSVALPSPADSVPDPSRGPAPSVDRGLAPGGPVSEAAVVDVVDGDTIKVRIEGTVYTLRYIGIDTPETVKPGSPVEWMGPEASAANHRLVDGETVFLERDVSETDRFGRLLRYVWLAIPGGWLMVNNELVLQGFAYSSAYPPDVKYQALFDASMAVARAADRGLWGATPPPSSASGTPSTAGDCDPSYPTVCIPPPPPDLDCSDISYRRFEVLPPDPHRFDGDHDGIGCEG